MAGLPTGRTERRLRRHKRRTSRAPLLLLLLVGMGLAGYVSFMKENAVPLSIKASAVHEPLPIVDLAREEIEPETEPEPEPLELVFEGVLEKNQTVGAALESVDLSAGVIHEVVQAASKEIDFRRSRPGDAWLVELDEAGQVQRFEYASSPEERWEVLRDGAQYRVGAIEVDRTVEEVSVHGAVSSSLWQSFDDHGASGALAQRFTDLFQYTVDFNSETQPGDEFSVVYEKISVDGAYLRDGRILAARYKGAVGTYYGFFHEDGENTGYFDAEGDNLKRQFLKSPLATVRITSNFGRRFHPVLKKMKLHAGVDYGAPTGTPVNAVADGTVIYSGWKGANGKLVSLRHSGGYVTHYAHLSQIGSKVKVGARVKQKDQIGRVGTTGRSTGPHLHFGMTRHGTVINPLKVDFARAEPLKGAEREAFQKRAKELMLKL